MKKINTTRLFIFSLIFLIGCAGRSNVIWLYEIDKREVITNKIADQNEYANFPIPYYFSPRNHEVVYFYGNGKISHSISIDKEYDLDISDDGRVLYLFVPRMCISCSAAIPVKTLLCDSTLISSGKCNCIMYPGMQFIEANDRYFYPGGYTSGSMRLLTRDFKDIRGIGAGRPDPYILIYSYEMSEDRIFCTFDEKSSNYSPIFREMHDSYIGSIDYNGNVFWQICIEDLSIDRHFSIVPSKEIIVYGYHNTEDGHSIRLFSFDGDEIYYHEFKNGVLLRNSNLINNNIALYDCDNSSVAIHNIENKETFMLFVAAEYESGYGDEMLYGFREIELLPSNHIVLKYDLIGSKQYSKKLLLFDMTGKYICSAFGSESKYNHWNPLILYSDKLYKCIADSVNVYIEEIY